MGLPGLSGLPLPGLPGLPGLPSLVGCAPPWAVVTGADDPWAAAELAVLRPSGGRKVRLNGDTTDPREFTARVAGGRDVATAMVDGRLTATLTGDWPGVDQSTDGPGQAL